MTMNPFQTDWTQTAPAQRRTQELEEASRMLQGLLQGNLGFQPTAQQAGQLMNLVGRAAEMGVDTSGAMQNFVAPFAQAGAPQALRQQALGLMADAAIRTGQAPQDAVMAALMSPVGSRSQMMGQANLLNQLGQEFSGQDWWNQAAQQFMGQVAPGGTPGGLASTAAAANVFFPLAESDPALAQQLFGNVQFPTQAPIGSRAWQDLTSAITDMGAAAFQGATAGPGGFVSETPAQRVARLAQQIGELLGLGYVPGAAQGTPTNVPNALPASFQGQDAADQRANELFDVLQRSGASAQYALRAIDQHEPRLLATIGPAGVQRLRELAQLLPNNPAWQPAGVDPILTFLDVARRQ